MKTEPPSSSSSSNPWGWLKNTLGLLVLFACSVPVLWGAFWLSSPPVPTFGQDAPFAEAVNTTFTTGMPIATVGYILKAEGFSEFTISADGRSGRAILNRQLLFCQDSYIVEWQSNSQAMLLSARGSALKGCN